MKVNPIFDKLDIQMMKVNPIFDKLDIQKLQSAYFKSWTLVDDPL